jgi:O-acetyl-ADP-ribose deacetylase (regulator of RNase III)
MRLGGCDTGDAKISGGYRLPASHVIHTVGPVWRHGADGEPELLARCYRRCLEVAVAHRLRSIAFPAISCGAYGYPLRLAVPIAVHSVRSFDALDALDRVVFACAGRDVLEAYEAALGAPG